MKNKIFLYIALLISFIALSSCGKINDIDLKNVSNVKVHQFENGTIYFSAGLQLLNPSSLSFRIKEFDIRIVANGDYLGHLRSTEEIKILSHSDSVYLVPMNLKLANIFTGAATLYRLSRMDKVKVEMQGYALIKTFIFSKKININEMRIVDVPRVSGL
jgi:LEA14-like dessication related protein